MNRSILLFVINLLFYINASAQLPTGTVLWSETWEGCGEHSSVEEYDFTGTYTYNNTLLEYDGSYHVYLDHSNTQCGAMDYLYFDKFSDAVFTVHNIPTGESAILYLIINSECSLNSPDASISISCDYGVNSYWDNDNHRIVIDNRIKKDYISITFSGYSYVLYSTILSVGDCCPPPIIQPVGGSYTENQVVSITCDDPEALIYYTIDGSFPDPNSDLVIPYNSPFVISTSTTVRAITKRNGYTSNHTSASYNFIDPSFDVGGIYYHIESFENNTVSAIGLVDNNLTSLTIPKTINYQNRTFTVNKLEFNDDIGKNVTSAVLKPQFDTIIWTSCNAESLVIHCNDNAKVVIGSPYQFDSPDYVHYSISCGSFNHNKRIEIIGNSVNITAGGAYPELTELIIKGSGNISGFNLCPNLTCLDLGTSILFETYLEHHYPPCWAQNYHQIEFIYAPIDTLIIGNVTHKTKFETIEGYNASTLIGTVHALPISQNHNRTIRYTNTDAIQRCSMSDSLNTLTIPSCVTKTWGKCASKVNQLRVEQGAPICEGIETHCNHAIQFDNNTIAGTVFFDRDASIYILNGLKCEQLTIGQHAISKGLKDAAIDVSGDSAFVKIYQMEPPALGNLFVNNTYVQVPLYVPKGTKTAYSTADNWKNFFNIIEFDWEGPEQTITVINDHPESGTVTGAGTYHWGDNVTLTAIPNEGCAFSRWIEDGNTIGTELTYSFVVNRDRTIAASFSGTGLDETTSQLTISTEDGHITINGADDASMVSVYNIQGQKIYHGSNKTINISNPGLYVVAIENKTIKVVVE